MARKIFRAVTVVAYLALVWAVLAATEQGAFAVSIPCAAVLAVITAGHYIQLCRKGE